MVERQSQMSRTAAVTFHLRWRMAEALTSLFFCSTNVKARLVALIVRPALASDAQSIGNLARQFACASWAI